MPLAWEGWDLNVTIVTAAPTPFSVSNAPEKSWQGPVWIGFSAALVTSLAVVPILAEPLSFSFYLMLYVVLASGFNVMAGFAGYLPLGYVAFYGVGAFATAIFVQRLGLPHLAGVAGGVIAGLVVAALFTPTLRLKGVYFAMVSLALAAICRQLVASLPVSITGGSLGVGLGAATDPRQSYFVMLALLVAALATSFWLTRSRLGLELRAVREDAVAAELAGIDVGRARLKAWLLSAGLAAAAGGIEAWYTNIVDPESAFQFLVTAKAMIFATAGGLGTIVGPVVGTLLMVWIDDLIWRRFPILNLLVLGIAIIAFVLFLPRGIVGTALRRYPGLRRFVA